MELQHISDQAREAKLRFGIVGNAPALIAAVERAIKVAPIDLSVLVTGESGTGKEFFPKIIHQYSSRKHAKYIAVNCGAIPEGTIDSELFGHEKGSFTGAVATRKGYFEEADGGTIFLDEVGELPLTTQARLLRVLESGEFIKVGSSTVQKANVRIVAATNVDMTRAVAEGRFREDLFYRLSTVTITVPPLRNRGNDIILLARKFASDFAEKYRMPPISLTDESKRLLSTYRWPGNVRELKNVIDQVALFDAGNTINTDKISAHLPERIDYIPAVAGTTAPGSYERERDMLFSMILSMQREIDALRQSIGNSTTGNINSNSASIRSAISVDYSEDTTASPDLTHSIVRFEPSNDHFTAPPTPTLEETEKETIRKALIRNGGRRKAAASELNISERTLYRKIKEYGLD
ncbi:MAG: sigma-54-dependent Fis family transcriptional regulator [Muribaculaceae bacterium]|nr:sigma-54-dependent Fis family transcriptional regulator [Muribaculaceae bacterium]